MIDHELTNLVFSVEDVFLMKEKHREYIRLHCFIGLLEGTRLESKEMKLSMLKELEQVLTD